MIETDKAYIAGLIDGEGYIAITIHNVLATLADGIKKRYKCFRPIVNIGMTNSLGIETIKSFYKASYWVRKTKGHKDVHYLMFQNMVEIKSLLEEILPYLKIKRDLAHLVISFIRHRQRARGLPQTKTDKEYYLMSRKLNKKGKGK